MTTRRPGLASRTPEMEEKEQLRRQIRLLQGLIDDYKNLHGSAHAPGTSASSQWQLPAYNSSKAFSARCPRPGRRGFSLNHGPAWRKKYSLVNRPPESSDMPGDCVVQLPLGAGGSQGPDRQQYVLQRQVQLSSDQNMVIKIKPPSKPGLASAAGVLRGSLEEYEDPHWSDHRPQEGEGEPPGGLWQLSRPGRGKGSGSAEDPLLVCQKEPGKPRVVKSVSSMSDGTSDPQRTVSESAVAIKPRFQASSLPQCSSTALGRKVSSHSVGSGVAQLLGAGRTNASHPDEPAPSGLLAGSARPAFGPRQARESCLLASCRTNKFRRNNYKWVAASAKSPRATRRALSPRACVQENVCKAPLDTAEQVEKPQLRGDPDAKPRRSAALSTAGAARSKYKWKASSPLASSSSSFHWQSEAGSKDRTSQLSPIPSRSPPRDRPAVGSSTLKSLISGTPLSAYKVKSRTKIIRRRGNASLPGDKKSGSVPATTAKSQFSPRRRQALRGKSSLVLKKTPNKGLVQVAGHRLCPLPPSRAHLPTKEASSVHTLRTPPTSKVIKTRYRIVKKTPASPVSAPLSPSLPSWRVRRLSLSRSLVLNRLRPATRAGKTQPSSPQWQSRGYRCIGGVLYRVSANKLSKTYSRPTGDGGSRPLLRTGRLDPVSSCSRSLASRAVQRSLAIVRQAKQRQPQQYCMYYNRFGRCNHGERCPYIHDPEKVAVCTRFVRGTCKKTDGTCPFSHHVSKEKMPVCSYFLKGICNNSDCPYSHVYVSRKAEVCTDFLKGYCPLGAQPGPRGDGDTGCPQPGPVQRSLNCMCKSKRCKKKHTLLCPDFSRGSTCPRGTQCQLLHRTQKRLGRRAAPAQEPCNVAPRSRASTGHGPRKSLAARHPATQTPSSPTSAAAGSASPPASPRVLPAASGSPSSSRAPSPASISPSPSSPTSPSPSVSLDQEKPSLQEETASAVMGSSSLSKLPAFISLQSLPSPGGPPRAQIPRSSPTKDSAGPRIGDGQRKPLHIKPRL